MLFKETLFKSKEGLEGKKTEEEGSKELLSRHACMCTVWPWKDTWDPSNRGASGNKI